MKTRLLALAATLLAATLLAAGTGCSNIDIALRGGDIGQSHQRKQSQPIPAMGYDVQQADYTMPANYAAPANVATASGDAQDQSAASQQPVEQALYLVPMQDATGNVQLVAYPAAMTSPFAYGPPAYGFGGGAFGGGACGPGGCGQGGYGGCGPGGCGPGYGHHHGYPGGPLHGGHYGYFGGAHRTPGYPHHHFHREYVGPQGPPTAQVAYPYYTVRGPRDFLVDNPPSIGR